MIGIEKVSTLHLKLRQWAKMVYRDHTTLRCVFRTIFEFQFLSTQILHTGIEGSELRWPKRCERFSTIISTRVRVCSFIQIYFDDTSE